MDSATVNGIKTRYFYNGKGERTVKRAADGSEILYHYDLNGQLIAESQKNGTVIREYIYLNSQPLALLENGNVYYYHNDHLGTPQVMTDAAQQVVWQGQYDPFGQATMTTEGITNNIRFPGQYYDAESGLHYNYFRYYDPATGRYMTSDPIGLAGGINTYAYVLNNPLYWTDPFGLFNIWARPINYYNHGSGTTTTKYRFAVEFYDSAAQALWRDYGKFPGWLGRGATGADYFNGKPSGVSDLPKDQRKICDNADAKAKEIFHEMGLEDGRFNTISESDLLDFLNNVRTQIPEVRELYPDSIVTRAINRAR